MVLIYTSNLNRRHWIVANIPGGDVHKGEEISKYAGAGPPKGSGLNLEFPNLMIVGLHRYVFLLFEQKGKIEVKELPR